MKRQEQQDHFDRVHAMIKRKRSKQGTKKETPSKDQNVFMMQKKLFDPVQALLDQSDRDHERRKQKPMPQEEIEMLEAIINCKGFIEPERMIELEDSQIRYMLKNSDLKFCSHEFFSQMKKSQRFMQLLCDVIYDSFNGELNINRNRLEYAIQQADKQLYCRFRDKKLTFDQFKARSAEINNLGGYHVLDDFREFLAPTLEYIEQQKKGGLKVLKSVAGRTVDEIVNPANDVSNPRCIRSLHQDHIMKKRDKDQLLRDIQ